VSASTVIMARKLLIQNQCSGRLWPALFVSDAIAGIKLT